LVWFGSVWFFFAMIKLPLFVMLLSLLAQVSLSLSLLVDSSIWLSPWLFLLCGFDWFRFRFGLDWFDLLLLSNNLSSTIATRSLRWFTSFGCYLFVALGYDIS
jgi:hypothetical protein